MKFSTRLTDFYGTNFDIVAEINGTVSYQDNPHVDSDHQYSGHGSGFIVTDLEFDEIKICKIIAGVSTSIDYSSLKVIFPKESLEMMIKDAELQLIDSDDDGRPARKEKIDSHQETYSHLQYATAEIVATGLQKTDSRAVRALELLQELKSSIRKEVQYLDGVNHDFL